MARDTHREAQSGDGSLEKLVQALGQQPKNLPPVERWDPPFCGDIDMRIAADGQWFYMGTPIGRPALVRLFASVLKVENGRHYLVTPVEKVGIQVEDAPLQAVEMAVAGDGEARDVSFRTNIDQLVTVGPDHPLRFSHGQHDGVRPYVHVKNGLWACLTRAVTYDLLAFGEMRAHEGDEMFGVMAGGSFWPVQQAAGLDGLNGAAA